MPRVLISGNHSLIRNALNALIASMGNMAVVGECTNKTDALGSAVSALSPNVVVMDVDLDGRLSQDELAALFRAAKGCPLLIVTAHDDPRGVACALQHGALGVVLKHRPAEVLMRALQAVLAGETWLERSIVVNICQAGAARRDVECETPQLREKLTRRETEIVELVRLGLQNKKIAERLFISETTVRHHLTSIYDKLAVTNRLELMRYAYEERSTPADRHICAG